MIETLKPLVEPQHRGLREWGALSWPGMRLASVVASRGVNGQRHPFTRVLGQRSSMGFGSRPLTSRKQRDVQRVEGRLDVLQEEYEIEDGEVILVGYLGRVERRERRAVIGD